MKDRAESSAHMRDLPVETVLNFLAHASFGRSHWLPCFTSRSNNTFSCWEEIRIKLALVVFGLLWLQTAGFFTSILYWRSILWTIMRFFWLRSVFIGAWVISRRFFQHRSNRAKLRFILSTSCFLWNRLTRALFRTVSIRTLFESHIVVWLGCWKSGDREHKFLTILYYIFTELRRSLKSRCGLFVSVVAAAFACAINAFMVGVVQFFHNFFEFLTAEVSFLKIDTYVSSGPFDGTFIQPRWFI